MSDQQSSQSTPTDVASPGNEPMPKTVKTPKPSLVLWVRRALPRLWKRLLNARISLRRGYLTLSVLALVLFLVWIGYLHVTEQRLITAARQDKATLDAVGKLYDFYSYCFGSARGQRTLEQLAAEFPTNPWPLIGRFWLSEDRAYHLVLQPCFTR
jgi:hypothetical protein